MSARANGPLKAAVRPTRMLVFVLSSEPLATLAGVYQDVRGQKPEEVWREAVSTWAGWLLELLPDLLGSARLRPLARASIGAFSVALEAVRHQKHTGGGASFYQPNVRQKAVPATVFGQSE